MGLIRRVPPGTCAAAPKAETTSGAKRDHQERKVTRSSQLDES
jgi:hypothetical protein